MKLFLLAGGLSGVWANQNDSLEQGLERGYPWIAHSSAEAFYLTSPSASAGLVQPYQISLYQGFTIQSLTFASFHLGLRSRDTYAPGLTQPYREPLAIKLAGTAEIFRDHLYVTMGGNFPVYTGEISLSDTGALYENLNQYSPLPVNAFLSPQALELGVFSRAQTPTLTLLGGFTYNRPARFDGIPNEPFFLASYFNILGRAILETKNAFHRFDFKSTIFKDEENAARIAAHHEGLLWQVRYGYLHSRQKVSWQGGLGFAIKMPDANRKFKLKSKLQSVDDNDNLQRVFGEYALSWVPRVNYAWRFHLVPKALFAVDGLEFGSETELGAGVGFKIWEVHRIRGGATFLYGNYAGKQYMGIGVKGEFAFRHLGFQDLEGESIDGGREP